MCGRFTLHLSELGDLRALLGVQRVLIADWQPRYNIAPSQIAPVIVGGPVRTLRPMRWGLVPPWARSPAEGNRLINARVETVATARAFRDAFQDARCVVPATGFFEWRAIPGQRKQPYWLRRSDERVLALAGLWSTWVSRDGEVIDSFTIITTDAQGAAREIHDRMPLSLHGADVDAWLREGPLPPDALADIVQRSAESDAAELVATPVDPRVNSSDVDDPDCIAPAPEGAEHAVRQLGLFSDDPGESRGMDGGHER